MSENTIINAETVDLTETENTETEATETTENGKKELSVKEIIANTLTCLMPYLKTVPTEDVTIKRAKLVKKASRAINLLYRANKLEYWNTVKAVLDELTERDWIDYNEGDEIDFAQLFNITLLDFDTFEKAYYVKYHLAMRYGKKLDNRINYSYLECEFTHSYHLDGTSFGELSDFLVNTDTLVGHDFITDTSAEEDFDF